MSLKVVVVVVVLVLVLLLLVLLLVLVTHYKFANIPTMKYVQMAHFTCTYMQYSTVAKHVLVSH